jgi:hypothetical protein
MTTSFDDFLASLPGLVPDLGLHPLTYVLQQLDDIPEGVVVECGVYEGGSIRRIANALPSRDVYGFDSFEGLPESWNRPDMRFDKGAFCTGRIMPAVPANVRLIPGWFQDTLPLFAAQLDRPIALLHVDCDIFSSTKCVLDVLGPHLADGCVLVFDELFCYPTYERHEILAFYEFLEATGRGVEWIGKHGPIQLAPTRDNGYWDQPCAVRLLSLAQ